MTVNDDIIFVGGIFPDFCYQEIIEKSRGNMQYAADALQKSLIEGLKYHCNNLSVVNLPFIGSWPKRYSSIWSPKRKKLSTRNLYGHYILNNCRFLNITLVKMLARYVVLKKRLFKILKKKDANSQTVIMVYSLHTPFLEAAIQAKKRYDNIKIISVVPDLPEFMSADPTGTYSMMKRYEIKHQNKLYKSIDGFVLLTDAMKGRLVTDGQPYEVIEGIFKDTFTLNLDVSNHAKKIIFYSGTLARRYNIMSLVEAVRTLKRNDFTLEIYGDGDCRHEIESISAEDSRIRYCGQKPREEILIRQKQSFLLVNPRNADSEYTKYSFPSKTMEYLGSGTPTLLYQLPGIPSDYYDYCFSLTDSKIETLSKKIDTILDMDEQSLRVLGDNARNFILKYKNPKEQTKKIINLIQKI